MMVIPFISHGPITVPLWQYTDVVDPSLRRRCAVIVQQSSSSLKLNMEVVFLREDINLPDIKLLVGHVSCCILLL